MSIKQYLLARRSDGKFLRLHKSPGATSHDYTDSPELAERVTPCNDEDFKNPHEAPYYFENSDRARRYWLKDCVMVPCEITTTGEMVNK